jgi:hypothetical protein
VPWLSSMIGKMPTCPQSLLETQDRFEKKKTILTANPLPSCHPRSMIRSVEASFRFADSTFHRSHEHNKFEDTEGKINATTFHRLQNSRTNKNSLQDATGRSSACKIIISRRKEYRPILCMQIVVH